MVGVNLILSSVKKKKANAQNRAEYHMVVPYSRPKDKISLQMRSKNIFLIFKYCPNYYTRQHFRRQKLGDLNHDDDDDK